MTTKTQKTPEQILKTYQKANKGYKQHILNKYRLKDVNELHLLNSGKKLEKKVTKTELAEIFLENQGSIITVSFQKPTKIEDTVERLMKAYELTAPINIKSALKKVLELDKEGDERIATGFTNGIRDSFNRIYFTETTVERDKTSNSDNRMILITLSNLNWLEINGIRYTKKK